MSTPRETTSVENVQQSDLLPGYPLRLLIIPAVVLGAMLVSNMFLRTEPINYDCAYYLLCAGLLADGKTPMADFVDILPPVVFYLSLPSVWLSQFVKQSISDCFTILTSACLCLSIVGSIIVMRRAKAIEIVDWLALGPVLVGFVLFNVILGFHFGQREHLFILALFPFFLIQWLRTNSAPTPEICRYLAAICGLACALVICVKPQLVMIPAAIVLSLLKSKRSPRRNVFLDPEVTFLIGGICFCFIVSFFIPGVNVYYERWVPFFSKGYAAFFATDLSILYLFVSPDGHMIGSRLALCVLCVVAYLVRRSSTLLNPLLAWTVAGLLVYFIQGRGWSYQSIPFVCGYFLLVSVIISVFATKALVQLEKRD